jgi:hypothetical protein
VEWVPIDGAGSDPNDDLPYATHEGVLKFGGQELKCYRLSSGERIIDNHDFAMLFEVLGAVGYQP